MNRETVPLFPLHTVLFPGGPLPLRIFEPRYIDMVSHCMKTTTGFGVCLISSGEEIGEAAATYEIGTLARIVDWHMRHDGLLGITACGGQRFRVYSQEVQPNKLTMAEVERIPDEPPSDVPMQYLSLVDMLRQLIEGIGHYYSGLPKHYGDASWVGFRLAELLPLRLAQKQALLQLTSPVQRLERICVLMDDLDIR